MYCLIAKFSRRLGGIGKNVFLSFFFKTLNVFSIHNSGWWTSPSSGGPGGGAWKKGSYESALQGEEGGPLCSARSFYAWLFKGLHCNITCALIILPRLTPLPGCFQTHLPGFVEKAEDLKAKGVQVVACIAINDAFVMSAWGKEHGAEGKARMTWFCTLIYFCSTKSV